MSIMEVKVFSTATCPYCQKAKAYLDEKGVKYENIDISGNPGAVEEMISLSGQMGVPVIIIDDKVVVGFDKEAIDNALQ